MYRTARAHPRSRCQVSFQLTLQLGPDLKGTLLSPPPPLPATLSAHLRVCAHARTHGTTVIEAFFLFFLQDGDDGILRTTEWMNLRFLPLLPHFIYDVSPGNQSGASFVTPHILPVLSQ